MGIPMQRGSVYSGFSSHGADMEVLGPEDFRDEIKADIAQMYKNYGL